MLTPYSVYQMNRRATGRKEKKAKSKGKMRKKPRARGKSNRSGHLNTALMTTPEAKREHHVFSFIHKCDDGVINIILGLHPLKKPKPERHDPSPYEIEQFLASTDGLIYINICDDNLREKVPALEETNMVEYFQVLLSVLHRWQAFRCWAPWVPTELVKKWQLTPAPHLTSVRLGAAQGFDIPRVAQILSPCWYSPALQQCSPLVTYEVEQCTEGSIPSLVDGFFLQYVPMVSQLTKFQFKNPLSAFECHFILAHATSVIDCDFGNISGPKDGGPWNPWNDFGQEVFHPLHRPTLKYLKLVGSFDEHLANKQTYLHHLFDTIIAPNLRSLIVEVDDKFREDSFARFMQMTELGLEALELDMVRLSPQGLYYTLCAAPALRILKVHGEATMSPQALSPALVDRLLNKQNKKFHPNLPPEATEYLCKELEMFSVNDGAIVDLHDGHLSYMIETRLETTPLQVVWICADPEAKDPYAPLYSQDKQALQKIKQENFRWKTFRRLRIDCDWTCVLDEDESTTGAEEEWRHDVGIALGNDYDAELNARF